ncbi:hypothetical protein BJV82DRAFT_88442 [Fennellomyces sp. T-0311]|nr:hypothetical protein BJV82DRAFT_88442 [Fennellomyces sp. T-0311]
MNRLTAEIKAFEKYLEPTKYETDCRERIVREAQQHVTRQLPTAQAYAFGSCETKLLLPNSDVDIAVVASNTEGKSAKFFIRKIQRHLGSVFQIEHLVLNAKVPLIKCIDRRSRLGVDITFQANTSSSTRTVKWLKEHPELKPLFLVIKHSLLGIRLELDPNYMALDSSRGGVASFVLICLIVHYLKYNERAKSFVDPATRLGQLLCGFLQFYAVFDFEKTGLTFSDDSGFFDTATDTTFAYRQDTMKHRIIIKSPDEPGKELCAKKSIVLLIVANRRECRASLYDSQGIQSCSFVDARQAKKSP